ncbi:forkhead box protein H1 [Pholidichthys leucotaenia]
MAKYPEKDVNILMGDLNTKIEQDNTGYEEVMGRHGLGMMNENGAPMDQDVKPRKGKRKGRKDGKKKNYQRHPKPPYTYVALIAYVIQKSPEKKLTLSEILSEMKSSFSFFQGNYKGWRDSVRHNLSSNDCFVMVLKDPKKPTGKGNYWMVDLNRIPEDLLKRQNTTVSRQDETIFAQDLTPYIIQKQKPGSAPPCPDCVTLPPPITGSQNPSPPQENFFRPRLDSSFAIGSLLHSLRPVSASGDLALSPWGDADRPQPASAPQPPLIPHLRCSSSGNSVSPTSISSVDEELRGVSRKRLLPDQEVRSQNDHRAPEHKLARQETMPPPWELPTSYSKYVPPNVVAPPSMRLSESPLMPLYGGLPFYSYRSPPVAPGHFLSPPYWPIIPSRQIPTRHPPLLMDLDNMLQSMPPNKSVFDAVVPLSQNSHQPPGQYTFQNGAPLSGCHQY